jgi:fermentation-respiration switch protein FrsA (DUF1100 family)
MLQGLAYLFALLLGGYALVAAAVYVFQDRLLFLPNLPSREVLATPATGGLSFEPVALRTSDGLSLDGWFVHAEKARGTVLFFHGNAGNISHRMESLRVFHALELDTLIFDYRGYGRSEGRPTEDGTYRDAEAAWSHLVNERGVSAERIVLFGRSLGAAVAAELATRHRAAGLILESTFTSVPDFGARVYPWLPVRWLSRLHYDTLARLPRVDVPVLVVHSPDDEIIPYAQGRRLFDAAREPKRFLEIRGGHNEGFWVSRQAYMRGLDSFLREVCGM